MNAPTIIKDQKPRISVADLFHMMEQGVIDPQARFELIEGGIVPRPFHPPLHQDIQNWLHKKLTLALFDGFWVAGECTLVHPDFTAVVADICVYPLELQAADLSGDKVDLVIEIAENSLHYDLNGKARLYSRMDVRELWVVDANARTTHVHRGPQEGGWSEIRVIPLDDALSPLAPLDVSLRLAEAG